MSILNRSTRFQGMFVLLVSALCTLAPRAEAAVQESGTSKVWHVHYLYGPVSVTKGKKHEVVPLPSGASLNAKVGPEGIVFQKKKEVLLSVPIAGIDQIAYDRESHRASRAIADKIENTYRECTDIDYLCGTVLFTESLVAALALPFKYTNHYVTISWQENGAAHVMELKLAGDDYLPFLSELQKATNKPWRNLHQERVTFLQMQKNSRKLKSPTGGDPGEVEATQRQARKNSRKSESPVEEHPGEVIGLKIEQDSLCGTNALPKGDYRVLAVGSGDQVDAYFFARDADIFRFRGLAHAQAENRVQSEPLEYAPDSARIVALRWGEKSLVFAGHGAAR